MVFVVLCKFRPQPDSAVLEILVIPKSSIIRGVVGVPIWVLTTRKGVHIEDRVDVVFGALSSNQDSCEERSV